LEVWHELTSQKQKQKPNQKQCRKHKNRNHKESKFKRNNEKLLHKCILVTKAMERGVAKGDVDADADT